MLSWIDTLFFGVRRILAAGVELPERPALNFVGAVCTDNPAENRTDVFIPGIWLVSPIVTSTYTARLGELVKVNLNDPVTITLPSALGNAGAAILIKEVVGGSRTLTLAAGPGQSVEGAPTFSHSGPWACLRLMSDGAGWLVVYSYEGPPPS
ncbi:uncharacterized protein SOCEGT47_057320 [Sorangium cellulosum]|uniref:Uncharacterized protein n=1 Tax=Sorangium cellulosum TaxID=56 RepID=A0A4P2Q7S1_SORCE|nr:hypothetical protein [Sorangium cellulosum]AUX25188.1 uncharacterized protein SOCEGT47_057320 [Sorangium cellulosum]